MEKRIGGRSVEGGRRTLPASAGRGGFTLIELLVVIAILSLLVSLLVPALKKAKDLAKDVLCAANLRGIALGWHFYLEDFSQSFYPQRAGLHYTYGGKTFSPQSEPRPLNPYVQMAAQNEDGTGLFECPLDRPITHIDGSPGITRGHTAYYWLGNCYMMNFTLLQPLDPETAMPILGQESFYVKDVVPPHSTMVMVGDWQWYYSVNDTPWDAHFHNYDDRMNLAFLDGHVSFVQIVRGEGTAGEYTFWPYEGEPPTR